MIRVKSWKTWAQQPSMVESKVRVFLFLLVIFMLVLFLLVGFLHVLELLSPKPLPGFDPFQLG